MLGNVGGKRACATFGYTVAARYLELQELAQATAISAIFVWGFVMSVTTEEFAKALKSLADVMALPKNDVTRDAAIQRFEFTVELAWKTSKKIMGSASSAPKEVVREMAQNAYISDVVLWLKAIDQRNLSSHTYNEALAEEVYAFAKQFLPSAQELLKKIAKK